MQPNRAAVIGTILAALGAFLTALLGAFDSQTAKAIVAATALVVAGAVVIVYLIGWQKHEARQSDQAPTPASAPPDRPPPLNEPGSPPS